MPRFNNTSFKNQISVENVFFLRYIKHTEVCQTLRTLFCKIVENVKLSKFVILARFIFFARDPIHILFNVVFVNCYLTSQRFARMGISLLSLILALKHSVH